MRKFHLHFNVKNCLLVALTLSISCKDNGPEDKRIKRMDPKRAAEMAQSIEKSVTPTLDEGLTLKLWGVDSLVADPIGIDIDDMGRLYYTRTNRQKKF